MASEKSEKHAAGMDGAVLDSSTLKKLSEQAIDGSCEAARRVSFHYSITRSRKAIYWTIIAAENGDSVGQYNAGFMLKDDKDPNNRRRAKYWLKKAVEQGDSLAQELLEEIQAKEAKTTGGKTRDTAPISRRRPQ